jgi:hypothetical protein
MTLHPSDSAFLKAFADCTIPVAEWKHRAHLKVAYLFLCRHPFAEALDQVRAGIQRYNAATNTPESLERGYHETITIAWLKLMHFTISEYGPAASADEFLDAQEQLLNQKALRFFYSRESLLSWRAKAEYVAPDLTPLPQSTKA